MKTTILILIGVMTIGTVPLVLAQPSAPERVIWNSRPIPVHVQRYHERIVHFPDEIRFWLPDSLRSKVSVIAANGVLYIRALETFPKSRMRVQGLNDQQIFLLDVVANDVASVNEELIVMTEDSVVNLTNNLAAESQTQDWRVRLTRYAAQALYAPERLLVGDNAIRRVPLDITQPIPLVRTGVIEATPIASWRGGGLTVTAVKLRNLQRHTLSLTFESSNDNQAIDLSRMIRGNWLTITVQHASLGQINDSKDTTTLYLVSQSPLIESLGFPLPDTALSVENNGG
ncbi:MAG: TIGR03749 family integrating conjugative element protein [Proteobacteria bacterium]|nr:TIGR03749 family integrating conjugative element protein [Pseudomonadota bacterium]